MTAPLPSGLHPGQQAGPAPHRHGHDHAGHGHPGHDHPGHDHSGHDHSGHVHRSQAEIEPLLPASPAKLALSPLASAGASRVAKAAGAVALLWVAVAWALGWLGA
jgi:hypothetical protein